MPYEWQEWALRGLVGIEPYEVLQALESRHRWPRRGTALSRRMVLTIWSRTRTGRPLIVALYHDAGFAWKIIGARDMTAAELTEFLDWERKR